MKKILITGSKSRAASRFSEQFILQEDSQKITLLEPDHSQLDITDRNATNRYISEHKPDWIIHFAAITDLSICEKTRGDINSPVWTTNVLGTQHIAESCEKHHIPLIYLSTSLVFSGLSEHPGPYKEQELPEKNIELLSWYGATKAAAENAIRSSNAEYCILRLSSTTRARYIEKKPDFLWKIMNNLKKNIPIPYFSDQHFSLTDLTELGMVIKKVINTHKIGETFHLSSPDATSPFTVADYLAQKIGYHKDAIHASTLETYSLHHSIQETQRFFPQYSGLSSEYTQKALGLNFKSWKEIVDAFILENKL